MAANNLAENDLAEPSVATRKVVQLCLSDGNGGLELYVERIITDLKSEGWEVLGLCLSNTRVEASMQQHTIPFRALSSNMQAVTHVLSLRRWLVEEEADVIHCHKSSDLRLITLLKLVMPGLRVLYTDHMGGRRPKKSPYHRLAYGSVERVLSISQATWQRNVRNLPLPKERVVCLPHGVDTRHYQPCNDLAAIHAKRRELGVPVDAVVIGLPGRVTPGKGQEVWVKALLELDQSLLFYALSIGGTDYASGGIESFYTQLQQLIAGTPLESRISFLGHRSDLTEILPVLDIVCIPSENEAFGLTIIESMACGMPIIGSNTGSLPELVDSASGVLVGPFDVPAWRDAMTTLIADAPRRQEMGAAARLRVEQHFSNQQHVRRLIEYYMAAP